jgi:HD superfamily phosphodiesterase
MFNELCKFIPFTSKKYNIDSSHDITHSMDVLHYAHNIYKKEVYLNPGIKSHENIIYLASTLHDMCDKKYMKEEEGLHSMELFLKDKIKISDEERNVVSSIINTMSYSKVKVNGFPNLGIYQSAYHIVREADLLSAYDFDRCLIYGLNVRGENFENTFTRAEELFKNRVLRHAEDNLFTTEYAKTCYPALHLQAINRISSWKRILHISS